MALLFQEVKEGIQLGKDLDKCKICDTKAKSKRETLQEGLLRNEEVFVLNMNGLRHCYCLDCFKGLLGKYILVDRTMPLDNLSFDLNKDEQSRAKLEESEKETVKEENKAIETEKGNSDDKKAKTSKSSKGK